MTATRESTGETAGSAYSGVKPHPALAEWGEIRTDTVNAAKYGENNPEAVRLMDRVGWR